MAINRVVLGIEEILDFSDATVDAPTALKGVVGYNSKGERFVGEYEGVDVSRATITPSTVLRGYIGHNAQGEEFEGEYDALDISDSTITPETVLKGYKGYDATGQPFVGTYVPTEGGGETTYEAEEFLTSGTFTVPAGVTSIDVHLVGGGAGGEGKDGGSFTDDSLIEYSGGRGGGSGYTLTQSITVIPGEMLSVTVGEGGAAETNGGASEILRGSTVVVKADGGKTNGDGGSGGGAANFKTENETELVEGGVGGKDGEEGASVQNVSLGGTGQGTTTRDWGENDGALRAQGGAGGGATTKTQSVANSGNGGNGATISSRGAVTEPATAGSSGIVRIRWAAA